MFKDYKIEAFSRPVSELDDNPVMSAGELKSHFDSNSYELLESLNSLIDALCEDGSLNAFTISGKTAGELLDEKAGKEELNELNEKIESTKASLEKEIENETAYLENKIDETKDTLERKIEDEVSFFNEQVGDISSALDYLHNYALSLSGGGEK